MVEIDDPSAGGQAGHHAVAHPDEFVLEPEVRKEHDRPGHAGAPVRRYVCCRRCQRVFLSSLRCFFFRIFLRRFLTTEGNPCVLSFDQEGGPGESSRSHPETPSPEPPAKRERRRVAPPLSSIRDRSQEMNRPLLSDPI